MTKTALNTYNKQFAAVLTGDIVNSQGLSESEFSSVIQLLKTEFVQYASKYDGHFDIFRGDAFQFVTNHAHFIMNILVGLRLALKAHSPSVDIRVSAAVGDVSYRNTEVKTGTGHAFVLSGRALDELKSQHIAFTCSSPSLMRSTSLLTQFADNHLTGLTQTQSETVLAYLMSEEKNHDNVAVLLGKNRSNVTRILNASRYKLIADYLHFMEQEINASVQEM